MAKTFTRLFKIKVFHFHWNKDSNIPDQQQHMPRWEIWGIKIRFAVPTRMFLSVPARMNFGTEFRSKSNSRSENFTEQWTCLRNSTQTQLSQWDQTHRGLQRSQGSKIEQISINRWQVSERTRMIFPATTLFLKLQRELSSPNQKLKGSI